jgi:tetratricopeptide (TPR) repeat protein
MRAVPVVTRRPCTTNPSMDAPLTVTLTCRRCHDTSTLTFDYAVVDPEPAEVDPAWDGIVLSRVVRCAKCGAEDDYALRPADRKRIVAEARRHPPGDAVNTGGARTSRGVLKDGTVVKRPSQAIAHAREVAATHPRDVAAQCRYGNVCSLFGLADEAERVWRRALQMSDEEAESAYNLAVNLWKAERWDEALPFIQLTLKRYPQAKLRPGLREQIGGALAWILEEAADMLSEPVALFLGIDGGLDGEDMRVIVSSVDLGRIHAWDRLAELLGSGRVLSGALTSDIPDPAEGPTNLERMLAGNEPQWSNAVVLEKPTKQWVSRWSGLWRKAPKKKQRAR